MMQLPDGKFLVIGQGDSGDGIGFALVRYNSDLSLDTSFGNGGIVTTKFTLNATATAVTLLQSHPYAIFPASLEEKI